MVKKTSTSRDTFIIRTEWWDAIKELDIESQSEIFKNLFLFHTDNKNLINLNNLQVKLVWKLIEPSLERHIQLYDKRIETSRENGKKGGRPKNLINLNNHVLVLEPVLDSDSVKKEKKEKKERATRWKEQTIPNEFLEFATSDRKWTQQQTAEVYESFSDYWIAKVKDATKLDWLATWRGWCRRQKNPTGGNSGQSKYDAIAEGANRAVERHEKIINENIKRAKQGDTGSPKLIESYIPRSELGKSN